MPFFRIPGLGWEDSSHQHAIRNAAKARGKTQLLTPHDPEQTAALLDEPETPPRRTPRGKARMNVLLAKEAMELGRPPSDSALGVVHRG